MLIQLCKKKLKYNLDEIFNEACSDYASVHLIGDGYESCIYLGVKIIRDDETGEVKIFDPQKSTNYYVEIDPEGYMFFQERGWRKAVIQMTLSKYKSKLERIKDSIAREINSSNSQKRLKFFKETREQILKKYFKLTQKLKSDD